MKLKVLAFLSIFFLFGCKATNPIQKETFKYAVDKPVEGQIHTAGRLRDYMDRKEYEQAINLFSNKQQETIRRIKEDKEMFQMWCSAWTFNVPRFERYITKITNNKAYFIFENGEWKIDER